MNIKASAKEMVDHLLSEELHGATDKDQPRVKMTTIPIVDILGTHDNIINNCF